jgi:hypothetical protein
MRTCVTAGRRFVISEARVRGGRRSVNSYTACIPGSRLSSGDHGGGDGRGAAVALPRRRREQHRSEHEGSGEIDGIGERAYHERPHDLAAIAHRPQPADSDALEWTRDLITRERGRNGGDEARRRPDREAPDAEKPWIRQERHAPEQRGVGEQAGNQHAHASPPVRDAASKPQRHETSEHAQADDNAHAFRPQTSALDQIEGKQEHEHSGLDGDQQRIGDGHEQRTGRAEHGSQDMPVAWSRLRRCRVCGERGPTGDRNHGHHQARRLEQKRTRRPHALVEPATPALPSNSPDVSLINNKLTARPRRCAAGTLTMAVVATVANMAQPAPPSARKPRNTSKRDVEMLATSTSAITRSPPIMSRRPNRPSR